MYVVYTNIYKIIVLLSNKNYRVCVSSIKIWYVSFLFENTENLNVKKHFVMKLHTNYIQTCVFIFYMCLDFIVFKIYVRRFSSCLFLQLVGRINYE